MAASLEIVERRVAIESQARLEVAQRLLVAVVEKLQSGEDWRRYLDLRPGCTWGRAGPGLLSGALVGGVRCGLLSWGLPERLVVRCGP